ncbi:flagellar hook-basal body complex protein FliE [Carnobacterium alterfunditum]|jgi:flagellar hook-basal body complex protein FliE|uniref:Flagellar hook-basal body complex protein FliE n=1 Tax=Carnobacterium alterfunditum TaxID=28230 RepID=A0A1N6I4N9_9LACT|nr:flagellar hook-basal body complex protein FliE [Carnobacterium alterfunditum]SIO26963.1 flagellar hook-basal body complex protein FliE [Carnobacterium alterfunditum]
MNVDALFSNLVNGPAQTGLTGGMNPQTDEVPNSLSSFSGMLENAMSSLNDQQVAADQGVQGLITGDTDNLHNVMIQTSEAQLSLEMALQLRNKGLEAYNEIKNMQF